jgi:hypothetical protein
MRQRIDGRNFVNPCWWLSAVIQAHCASGADGRSWWDRWPLIKHHMAVRYWANWTAALDGRCWPSSASRQHERYVGYGTQASDPLASAARTPARDRRR